MSKVFALIGVCAALALSGLQSASAEPDPASAKFLSMAAEQSKAHWQGQYWAEEKFPDGQKAISGRNCHYFTLLYWNIMQAKANGDKAALQCALGHFDSMDKLFWDQSKGLFNSDYDFLMNASVAISLGLALRDASDAIPPEYQARMKEKLRAISAFLPTYDTALFKLKSSLRANNQEAFAALALALSSEVLGDATIRDAALLKLRSVLAVAQQSFWIEGGVDVGYQQVGEPPFGAAADILWDSLSREERRSVTSLLMVARVGNGYGLENARSPSWLRESGTYLSSAILNRIDDPFIAFDAKKLFQETAAKGFNSKWWLYDPSSLAFFSGYLKYKEKIEAMAALQDFFPEGSLAAQIMDYDENKASMAGMEKAYLSGDGRATALFGDYSRFCPKQALAKFGNDKAPRCWNSGGLRYFGFNRQLFIMADEDQGYPRLVPASERSVPQLVSRRLFTGVFAPQYSLVQTIPGLAGGKPLFIEQSFLSAGPALIVVFRASGSLDGAQWVLSSPAVSAKLDGASAFLAVPELKDPKKNSSLAVSGFNLKPLSFEKEPKDAYFKLPVDMDSQKVGMPKLRLLKIPFADAKTAVVVAAPESAAAKPLEKLSINERGSVLELSFSWNGSSYSGLMALEPQDSLSLPFPKGGPCVVAKPEPGFLQLLSFDPSGELKGFSLRGASASGLKGFDFKAKEARCLSALRLSDGSWLFELDGSAELPSSKGCKDLSAGGSFKPGAPLDAGRYLGGY